MSVTCPLACTKYIAIKAEELSAPRGEWPLALNHPSVCPPPRRPRGRTTGRRTDRRRRFEGCFATRWRSSDQCQSRPRRGEQPCEKKKKNLGLCSFCIPGAARIIIALTGLRVTKSRSGCRGRGGSCWGFSVELKPLGFGLEHKRR